MSAYNLVYNKDESIIRQLIVGLLADLNQKVFYYNQIDDDTRVKVEIPFMYHITGDEAFLQQFFLNDSVRDENNLHAKTNYESLPRGIINMTSMNIDSSMLLNKYVYGMYNRLVGQEMKTFHAQFQMIPINMSFDVSIKVDNQLDTFKVAEAIIKRLYKNNVFNIEVGHPNEALFRSACFYKMPEEYTKENPIEFSLDDDKRYQITFSLEMVSFIPSFDFEHEQFAGNRMFTINHEMHNAPKRISVVGFFDKPSGNLDNLKDDIQRKRQNELFNKKIIDGD